MFRAALHMVISDFFHLRLGASVGGGGGGDISGSLRRIYVSTRSRIRIRIWITIHMGEVV